MTIDFPPVQPNQNDLNVYFLAQNEQRSSEVARHLAEFIGGATTSLDMALYDFRLGDGLKAVLTAALAERTRAGVAIRIVYDSDKQPMPNLAAGQDPAPAGTEGFVHALGYPSRPIGGFKLMHNKYIIRDAHTPQAQIWTGSTNFTDDAWSLMENNVLEIASPQLANYYSQDFEVLWASGQFDKTGNFDTQPLSLTIENRPATVQVLFSPGRGEEIDREVAIRVSQAQWRLRICSMLLNSGTLLNALLDLLQYTSIEVAGIYDRTQMREVLQQWQDVPSNHWKIKAIQEVVQRAHLIGKNSTPYSPTGPHDFMHNKILVIDNTVITGSYNFSRSAMLNAENILFIESQPLADAYCRYIDYLIQKYNSV